MAWLGDYIDRLSDFDKEMNGVVVESGGWVLAQGGNVSVFPAYLPRTRISECCFCLRPSCAASGS
jgi:hypothetical protein